MALVIVLAFVVLLTGLIIAFFSRSILDRQISNSSMGRAKVSAFADGATNSIIGELKQEIVLSFIGDTGDFRYDLYAAHPGGHAPADDRDQRHHGHGELIPLQSSQAQRRRPAFLLGVQRHDSLFRRQQRYCRVHNDALLERAVFYAGLLESALSSADHQFHGLDPGGRFFVPPSWVLVARDGSNPAPAALTSAMTATGTNPIVGRYAFAIYHEGGLLDVNAAGYPSTTGAGQSGAYKPALAYADLTQLPGGLTTGIIDKLVAWRNFASIPVPGTSFLAPAFSVTSGDNYYNMLVSNTTGFLSISATASNNNQTDRMFASRQQLIGFLENGLGITGTNLNVLNYLATFTRDLNQPSYIPAGPDERLCSSRSSCDLGGNSAYLAPAGMLTC